MASARKARLYRRLRALEGRVAHAVAHRVMLRERAGAGAAIRAALAASRIAPDAVSCLRYADEAAADLAARGDGAALGAADRAFVAANPTAAPAVLRRDRLGDRARALMPRWQGRRPPDRGAALIDWYAWALARDPAVGAARSGPLRPNRRALRSPGWSPEERIR